MDLVIINLSMVVILGILYMFFYARIADNFFNSFAKPKTNAVLILFVSTLLSAGINLYHISDIASTAFNFYYGSGQIINAFIYYIIFFAAMWIFSFVFFRISFELVSRLSKENEKVELAKNNIEVALVHSVILIVLSFVIAPALVSFASKFISFPPTPF
jgi:hypothetical protein